MRTFFSSMSFHTWEGQHVASVLVTLSRAGGLSLVTQDVSYYVAESVLLALSVRVSAGRAQSISMWIIFSIKIPKLILFLLLPSKFDNLMWLCPASNHDNSQLKCLGLSTLCIWVYLAHNTILLQYSSRIKDKKNYWRIWMKKWRGGGPVFLSSLSIMHQG